MFWHNGAPFDHFGTHLHSHDAVHNRSVCCGDAACLIPVGGTDLYAVLTGGIDGLLFVCHSRLLQIVYDKLAGAVGKVKKA